MPIHGMLAEMPAAPVAHTDASWHPIRNYFGITAFGINGYTAARAGDRIIGEHDHADPEDEQHQELYFVLDGRVPLDQWSQTVVKAYEYSRVTHRPVMLLCNLMGG